MVFRFAEPATKDIGKSIGKSILWSNVRCFKREFDSEVVQALWRVLIEQFQTKKILG
jgi:hypothetical protein